MANIWEISHFNFSGKFEYWYKLSYENYITKIGHMNLTFLMSFWRPKAASIECYQNFHTGSSPDLSLWLHSLELIKRTKYIGTYSNTNFIRRNNIHRFGRTICLQGYYVEYLIWAIYVSLLYFSALSVIF